jgi:glycine cleavage system H protein
VTEAPDFIGAVAGFRAWHVGDDALLRPWSFPDRPWVPGVNTATCALHPGHHAPEAGCGCGLYALADPGDRRLDFHGDQVVGAIAAWGDMEVHRTGFRAEQACVVALARPARAARSTLALLEAAAERYRVALVDAPALEDEALLHAEPLPAGLWDELPAARPRRAERPWPAISRTRFAGARRGIVEDDHVWVETSVEEVTVGLTRAYGQLMGETAVFAAPAPGHPVGLGDRLLTVASPDGSLIVWTPVSGIVTAVNPALESDPGLLTRDPEGAGWLLRVAPSAWDAEASRVSWDRRASDRYRAALAHTSGPDPFQAVRASWLEAMPPVASWGDVLRVLRREREAPRWAEAAQLYEELGGRLSAALDADAALCASLARLDLDVVLRVTDPDATLTLALRGGGAAVVCGERPRCGAEEEELELALSAEDAARYFTGALDPVRALRRGEIRSSRTGPQTLRVLSILKALRIGHLPRKPSWARATGA